MKVSALMGADFFARMWRRIETGFVQDLKQANDVHRCGRDFVYDQCDQATARL
ncbi:hypothetical protein MJD09_15970 [bacterium]|nr:hypothetical protein [bacterium]